MSHDSLPNLPKPSLDLRTQLLDRVIREGFSGLESGNRRRENTALTKTWDAYRTDNKSRVIAAFGPMPFGKTGGPLNMRIVSTHETKHCRIENLLFDSYPGWEVNATLYVPRGDGPFPAIVLPVGHSGKQFENYQIPAQAYASLGYIAVSFDPPGQASEKQTGNDHFRDGVRSFLFGITPNRFFVLDALRCIDYLETRPDADLSRGVAMSGVSGGGVSTLYAALFDDRITCFGPSCCLNPLADHPIGDAYSSCPEGMWYGRVGDGIDNVDIALACAPKPMLYMAGKHDEVFHVTATRSLVQVLDTHYSALEDANENATANAMTNSDSRFSYFEDESGHAYTLEQTCEFDLWMRRWMYGETRLKRAVLRREDFDMLDFEMLKCHPSQSTNMFTIHRDMAAETRGMRMSDRSNEAVATAREKVIKIVGAAPEIEKWTESQPFQLWSQGYSEALCQIESLEIPISVLRPWRPYKTGSTIVYLDENGRKHALEGGGPAAPYSRMIERDENLAFPAMYVPDLPGWGDSSPALTPYQIAGWGSMDRLLSYHSFGNGDGVLAMQIRAAAALVDEIARKSALPEEKTVIFGTGLGGVIAILAAAITRTPAHAIALSPLASFESLLETEYYTWPSASFLPNVLDSFDIPEIVEKLRGESRRVLIVDPLDGTHRPIDADRTRTMFGVDDTHSDAGRDQTSIVMRFIDEISSI
jgi:cephalosporin-C deacetylase-like acetyl esterase